MAVGIPERLLPVLKSLPNVRRVYPVYQMKAQLERALPRHGVIDAWTLLGGHDLAGAGVKIAIIDTGIDPTHPAFQDPSIPMPEGFPRANFPEDLTYTNNKVIVARSYVRLLGMDANPEALDVDGHGTQVASAAAGVLQQTDDGPIGGAAPKAWVGNYKVFPTDGNSRSDVVLKAIDDAVRDGMDVINLSLGSSVALRPKDTLLSRVVERLASLGITVVVSAGNAGPDPFSIGDTAVPPSALSVGATWNDRILTGKVRLSGGESFQAIPGGGPRPGFPLSAPLFDVAQVDPSGLACEGLPAGSLAGRLALILRGVCFFEDKLNNATAAGAVGAIVYTDADRPEAITMAVGGARLPAAMVSHPDGLAIKNRIAAGAVTGTIDFWVKLPRDPNQLASFSSRGPNTDLSIKPDLVATGEQLNMATLSGGYLPSGGTSFSAPLVAGAVATLKAARPGLAERHYRSLLVNTAKPVVLAAGAVGPVQQMGGGSLDLAASLASSVTVSPVSVSFGAADGPLARSLTITNLSAEPETLAIWTQPFDGGPAPQPSAAGITIPAHGAAVLTLELPGPGPAPGEYQGFLRIQGSRPGTDIHVPYWYAVRSDTPASIGLAWSDEAGNAGSIVSNALAFRVLDGSGLPLTAVSPRVVAVSGGGSALPPSLADELSPGLFLASVRLGNAPGNNVFRIEAGAITREVTIVGE